MLRSFVLTNVTTNLSLTVAIITDDTKSFKISHGKRRNAAKRKPRNAIKINEIFTHFQLTGTRMHTVFLYL